MRNFKLAEAERGDPKRGTLNAWSAVRDGKRRTPNPGAQTRRENWTFCRTHTRLLVLDLLRFFAKKNAHSNEFGVGIAAFAIRTVDIVFSPPAEWRTPPVRYPTLIGMGASATRMKSRHIMVLFSR